MNPCEFWPRVHGRYQRTMSRLLFKRPLVMNNTVPIISFTFDDFPRSSLFFGGEILRRFGFTGTYYASFGLMGGQAPTGEIFQAGDLKELLAQGHELGCHTFSHCHSWETGSNVFERSIAENQKALSGLLHEARFKTFSYPISPPRLRTKRLIGKYFVCARGGGQTMNSGTADLDNLSGFFLEQSRDDLPSVKSIIDRNSRARGWLIFATHDICVTPTPYGCTPEFFEAVVQYAAASGAAVLPVAGACERVRGHAV